MSYGDPWEYTAVAASKDGVEIVIMGFRSADAPVLALAVASIRLLRSMGSQKIVWERIDANGKVRLVDASGKRGT